MHSTTLRGLSHGALFIALLASRFLSASAIIPGTLANTLPTGDDISSSAVVLGLGGASGLNLFGASYTSVYVNSNGNVTFGSPLSGFVVDGLANGVGLPIFAPFFADVDTRGAGAITYGNLTVNGRTAFLVDWTGVGYYSRGADKVIPSSLHFSIAPTQGLAISMSSSTMGRFNGRLATRTEAAPVWEEFQLPPVSPTATISTMS